MEEVRDWLTNLNLQRYHDGFIDNGYDDLDAIHCLDDEDLDAIGITDPAHRQLIASHSQQQASQSPNDDDAGIDDIDNVLSDLDTIIGELGAFGVPDSIAAPSKPKVAPKPFAAKVTVTPVKRVTPITTRTSSVFVETESGPSQPAVLPEDDFDLDSLLYDIVKFDPTKVIEQQQQERIAAMEQQQQQASQVAMVSDSSVAGSQDVQVTSGNGSNVEIVVMPDLRSASVMISDEEVRQRLDKLKQDLLQDNSLTEDEVDQKLKQEKMRIALEKMKLANVKKVAIKVFNHDNSSKTLVVEEGMTSAIVCHLLVVKNLVDESPQWALIEKWDEFGIERILEDHEMVVDVYTTWPRVNSNTFVFKRLPDKYDLFENPMRYFPSQLSVSAESAYKHGAQERAEKARKILLQEYFSSTHRVPEVEGILYCKEGCKKPWKKLFFILRPSGLYYSTKGKSKLSKNLRVFVQFEGHHVYYGIGLKKTLAAPSEHCFCVKTASHGGPATAVKDVKILCAESEQLMITWVAGIRLARYGLQLRDNYHKSHSTQFKLDDIESDSRGSVEERQQKLPGMIVERHLDRIRDDYQRQQEDQQTDVHKPQLVVNKSPVVANNKPLVVANTKPLVVTNKPTPVVANRQSPVDQVQTTHSFSMSVNPQQPRALPALPVKQNSPAPVGPPAPVGLTVSFPPPPTNTTPTSFSWYHGDISRDIAVRRLEDYSMVDGTFLIRQSKSCIGTYVLTMAAEGIIRNFQIQPHPNTIMSKDVIYRIDDGPEFASIHQLIEHYKQDADRLPCKLVRFCPK